MINEPSCHRLPEAQPLMGLQRALRTERAFVSDKKRRTASQVEKEGGEQRGSAGGRRRGGEFGGESAWAGGEELFVGRGRRGPSSSPGGPSVPPDWSLDTLEPHEPESAVSESIVPAPRGSET